MSGIFFHVSRCANRNSIKARGLVPANVEFTNIERAPAVYLFASLAHAKDWAFWFALDERAPVDIWRVHVHDSCALVPDPHPEIASLYDALIAYEALGPDLLDMVFTQSVPLSASDAPPFVERE